MASAAHVTPFEIYSAALGFVSVVLIPALIFAIRGAIKWTRVETKLDTAIEKLSELASAESAARNELAITMRADRAATDQRLRHLERHVWSRQGKRNSS